MESTILSFAKKPSLDESRRKNHTSVNLISNYLKMTLKPNNSLVKQYSIKYLPEIALDNLPLKRKIIRGIRRKMEEVYITINQCGDTFFSPMTVDEKITFQFTDDQQYQIIIEKTDNETDLSNIKCINKYTTQTKNFIDNLLKNILNANNGMIRFDKKSIFDYNSAKQVNDSIKGYLMQGYCTSATITESGMFLKSIVKKKFINGITCYEQITEISKNFKNGNLEREITEYFKNRSVMTTYGKYQNYKIDAVSFDLKVWKKTIPYRDRDMVTSEITLEKYYLINYNKKINDLEQPLLVHFKKNSNGEREAIYLVPELCYLTGMDENMRTNESFKRNMVHGTKMNPKQKMDDIYKIKQLIEKKNPNKTIKINRESGEEYSLPDPCEIAAQWGFSVTDFKDFKGRILTTPRIQYRDEKVDMNNGKWRSKKIYDPKHFERDSWVIICSVKNKFVSDKMISSFKAASDQMGIVVSPPQIMAHEGRYVDDWIDFIKSLELDSKHDLKIVLTVLDKYTESFYKEIKNFLYTKVGIPSQMAKAENHQKNLSYYTNLLQQMVAKMGGAPYAIQVNEIFEKNVSFRFI